MVGALVLGCTGAMAADLAGLEIGAKAPSFMLKDQDGKSFNSETALKRGPVAIVFYRSADW